MNNELDNKLIMNDGDAKEFFIKRLLEQAKKENAQISETEKQMIYLQLNDPNSLTDPGLAKRIKNEIKKAEYERKISWLIKSGYDDDLKESAAARDTYKLAYKAIKTKDYYIYFLVDKAIGRDLNKAGFFMGSYPTAKGFVLQIILFGFFFIIWLGNFFSNNDFSSQRLQEKKSYIYPALICGFLTALNIRGYIKFKRDDYYSNKKNKK